MVRMPDHLDVVPAEVHVDPQTPAPALAAPAAPTPMPAAVQAAPTDPGRTLGIVGFALSLVVVANLVGLILSIVGLMRSRRVGRSNGFAVAGIVISAVGVTITTVLLAIVISTLVNAAQMCASLGDGVHHVNGSTYTCTPTSFAVYTGTAD